MRHLYNTRAEVLRLSGDLVDGAPRLTWQKITDMVDPLLGMPGEMMCRLDLSYLRPGRDAPQPIVAGRAQDRSGLLFCDVTTKLKAGDRIRTLISPTIGVFELPSIPDVQPGFSVGHHIEIFVIEVAQQLVGVFPGGEVDQL